MGVVDDVSIAVGGFQDFADRIKRIFLDGAVA